jgi:hypothetical protein
MRGASLGNRFALGERREVLFKETQAPLAFGLNDKIKGLLRFSLAPRTPVPILGCIAGSDSLRPDSATSTHFVKRFDRTRLIEGKDRPGRHPGDSARLLGRLSSGGRAKAVRRPGLRP